jgi:Holliday junction DNA helicase RuvA
MFSELCGTISRIYQDSITLRINGVGYLISMPEIAIKDLELNSEISLLTEVRIKTEKLVIFGFINEMQQFLFNRLGGISGISDKLALNLCGIMTHEVIHEMLETKKLPNHLKINGLGQKTWEKILFDLQRDKNFLNNLLQFKHVDQNTGKNYSSILMKSEAISALINIGLNRTIANDLVEKAIENLSEINEEQSTEALIKKALSLNLTF